MTFHFHCDVTRCRGGASGGGGWVREGAPALESAKIFRKSVKCWSAGRQNFSF